jgi:hypothetical protein
LQLPKCNIITSGTDSDLKAISIVVTDGVRVEIGGWLGDGGSGVSDNRVSIDPEWRSHHNKATVKHFTFSLYQ